MLHTFQQLIFIIYSYIKIYINISFYKMDYLLLIMKIYLIIYYFIINNNLINKLIWITGIEIEIEKKLYYVVISTK